MLTAQPYYSGFPYAHDTYNAISKAKDGRIYYVLSSDRHDEGGKMYVYDPENDETKLLGDLTEICGERELNAIVQGKSHSRFYEFENKLFFSTHVGYYELIDGMDRLPENFPENRTRYPGGHFLAYDPVSGVFEDLCKAPDGEGFVTMNMDTQRGHLYGITWPSGQFIHYDTQTGVMYNAGLISHRGESGMPGVDFRSLCRSLLIDSTTGKVYFTVAEGDVLVYDPESKTIEKQHVNLRLDYFGNYDYKQPGSMSYNWRKVFWHPREGVGYGVHGNSGYLFKFKPTEQQIEIVTRLTSIPSQKSGMFDQFSYGYLGFQLGPDGETIYYLTGAPVYEDGQRVKGVGRIAKGASKGVEDLHLVTYHIPSESYRDHGPIFYPNGQRPSYVNSIAVGDDGFIYTLARFTHEGREISDLIKIPNPLA